MTESDARQVLLVRAVETAAARDTAALWRDEDAAWAGAEARRRVGEHASAQTYLAARADLALQRLGERDAAWRGDPLRPGQGALAIALVSTGLVLAAGIVGNVLGPERRINLLAPPVWGLLAWNLLVYAALALGALRRWRKPAVVKHAMGSGWAGVVRRISTWVAARSGATPVAAVRARHVADWALVSAPLQAQRMAAGLHAAAALLALGVVLSMYLFGLVLDFRAGWAAPGSMPRRCSACCKRCSARRPRSAASTCPMRRRWRGCAGPRAAPARARRAGSTSTR